MLRMFGLVLALILLCGCEDLPQKKGELSGSADIQQNISLNAGSVRFTITMDHDKPQGQPMIINLRDRNGSIIKELFRSDVKKTAEASAEAEYPGDYSIEVRGSGGAWRITWRDPDEVAKAA